MGKKIREIQMIELAKSISNRLIPAVTTAFFLISGSAKHFVIDYGQEIQLLNDKIDCLH